MQSNEVEERFLDVIRRCGSVVGVWPYSNNRLKWAARFVTFLVAVTGLTPQVARIVYFLSADTVIEQSPFFLIGIALIVKVTTYIVHEEQIRTLFECIFDDWMVKRPKGEIDIMDKYAKRGLFFCRLYVLNGCCCYVIFTLVAVTPRVLDLVSPRNESRGVRLIYPAYYAIDEEEHYYIILGHMLIGITTVFFVYISCDSIYMTVVQHACGLLNVSGYRFTVAIKSMGSCDRKEDDKTMENVYRTVCHSIKAHQHAMDYIMKIQHVHEKYLFMIVALVMLALSVTLVKTSLMDPCMEFYKYCGFLVVQLVHLLFLSIQGHFIIVSNDAVYNNIYAGLWYNSTPKTQALYALALRRNLTPPVLTAGGLMTLNLESFSQILKASVSYFTVLKSG